MIIFATYLLFHRKNTFGLANVKGNVSALVANDTAFHNVPDLILIMFDNGFFLSFTDLLQNNLARSLRCDTSETWGRYVHTIFKHMHLPCILIDLDRQRSIFLKFFCL